MSPRSFYSMSIFINTILLLATMHPTPGIKTVQGVKYVCMCGVQTGKEASYFSQIDFGIGITVQYYGALEEDLAQRFHTPG